MTLTISDDSVGAPVSHGTIPSVQMGMQTQQQGMAPGAVLYQPGINYPPQYTYVSTIHAKTTKLLVSVAFRKP